MTFIISTTYDDRKEWLSGFGFTTSEKADAQPFDDRGTAETVVKRLKRRYSNMKVEVK